MASNALFQFGLQEMSGSAILSAVEGKDIHCPEWQGKSRRELLAPELDFSQ